MTHESESTYSRSQLLGGAAKLGAGALGAGALLGASSASAAIRSKRIAVIEQQFGTFFTEIFHKPAKAYLKKFPDWSITFGNENSSLTTGVNLMNQYVTQGYGAVILSVGQDMSAWQNAVKNAVSSGTIFINHSTQAVTGATQNTLFSHKQAGVDVGNAAVKWAKRNHVANPVVALIGNLSDAQGKKRTDWAWKTIKARIPSAKLAGQAQGIGVDDGGKAAANLLAAHPDVNILVTFNTLSGLAALTSARHAGKNDRNSFLLASTDSEDRVLKLIADSSSIYQIAWGAFFPASMILMLRDIMKVAAGKKIPPTRLIYGLAIETPAQAKSFDTIVFNPLDPKYAYVFTKYFKYLDTPVKTAQVPPGQ